MKVDAPAGAAASLEARLSAFDGAMVVLSLVIGIGIFRTPALVAGATGGAGPFLLAWTIGGAASLAGALLFAEIGSRSPKAGGFYAIVADCWHPLVGFLVNWAQVLMQGVGAATVAVIGSEYLVRMAGASTAGQGITLLLAAALIAGLTLLSAAGVRAGARTQNALSLAKVALIAALTVAGLTLASPAAAAAATAPGPAPADTPGPAGLLAALVAVFYTYGGYQNTMNLAGDITAPRRNLPRAVFGGMALVTALYLGINVAYVRALGAAGVAASPLVAADLARAALGSAGERLVSLAIFLSAAGFVNATILHMPRGYLAMARDGLLPSVLGRITPRTQAQHAGLAFFAGTALIPLMLLESFERLVSYVIFTDTISMALLASCLFVLRRRQGAAPRGSSGATHGGFRMPGYPWLPALFVVIVLGVAANLLVRETVVALGGILVVMAGLPLYLFMRRRGTRPRPA